MDEHVEEEQHFGEERHFEEEQGGGSCGCCAALGIGLVLFVAGLTLGGWNEYRSVATAKAIAQGRDSVVEVPCSPIDPLHRHDLVHLACPLTGHEILGKGFPGMGDGVSGLQLKSDIEVFQWVLETIKGAGKEESKKDKRWKKKWERTYQESTGPQRSSYASAEGLLDSRDPHQTNPPLSSRTWWDSRLQVGDAVIDEARNIKVGDFAFPSELLSSVVTEHTLSPNCSATTSCPVGVTPVGNALYYKYDYGPPTGSDRVGDMRQTLRAADASFASVVAQQSAAEALVPWPSAYDPSYTIFLATGKDATAQEMFATAESDNVALTWILRLVTWACTSFGIFLLLSPLGMLVAWVPCLGGLLEGLVDVLVCGVSCAIGCMCWTMVAGFVWVFYRPYVGVPLLLLSGGIFAWLVFFKGKGMQRRPFDLEGRADIELANGPPAYYNPEAASPDKGDSLFSDTKPEESSAPSEPMNFCGQCGARKPVSTGTVCRACAAQG